jgi:hypothetical protein
MRPELLSRFYVLLAKQHFLRWVMLGSNQRPLPCEGSAIVCWMFPKLAKFLQMEIFDLWRFSRPFRRFTRVAAWLLHVLAAPKTSVRIEECKVCSFDTLAGMKCR